MINEMRIVHHIVRIRITVIHIRQNIYQTSDCKRLKSQSVLDSFKLFLSFLKQAPVEREPIGNAERRFLHETSTALQNNSRNSK
jgi:hypothetical protein